MRFAGLRKQYYFKSTGNRLCAWDVDRLIEQTRDVEPEWVSLDSIKELDENFWFGGEGDVPSCRAVVEHARLIQQADMTFPIILSSTGRVMDGMHRVCRALIDGTPKIAAVRFTQDPEPDYEDVQSPDELPY
ncbi:MAG: hypothetical protein AB2827_18085 [Candidatus Thiodiazotropha sp.]